MRTPQQRVLSFFSVEFDRYILPDIDVLSKIRRDRAGLRACSIPQALLVFSVLDLLAFLTNPDADASKRRTKANYAVMFTSTLSLFPSEYAAEAERLIRLFRHGVVHQFFPKVSAIAKVSVPRELIFQSGNTPCLNVDKLTQDTVSAIGRLRTLLADGTHSALVFQMNQRLDQMNEEDAEERDDLS